MCAFDVKKANEWARARAIQFECLSAIEEKRKKKPIKTNLN